MLDKNDLKAIKNLIDNSNTASEGRMKNFIKESFADFYESIFLPHAERSDKEHQEIKLEIRSVKEELSEYIKDHEKRIKKLERVTNVN